MRFVRLGRATCAAAAAAFHCTLYSFGISRCVLSTIIIFLHFTSFRVLVPLRVFISHTMPLTHEAVLHVHTRARLCVFVWMSGQPIRNGIFVYLMKKRGNVSHYYDILWPGIEFISQWIVMRVVFGRYTNAIWL